MDSPISLRQFLINATHDGPDRASVRRTCRPRTALLSTAPSTQPG